MEWKNDVLSFSGFDYGVSKQKTSDEFPSELKALSETIELSETTSPLEELNNKNLDERIIPRRMKDVELTCDFDPMTERKIENVYFLNIEQAERKMKKLTVLKSKWSEPWETGEEIIAKNHLKPKNHQNPWKDGTIQEKEAAKIQNKRKNHGTCVIS